MRKKMLIIICILAALFCFAYCLVVFMIRSGSRFYLVWAIGGFCFICLEKGDARVDSNSIDPPNSPAGKKAPAGLF